jgi:hypothetical protein
MALTINWNIVQLNCYPDKDGLTDVVFTVHWDCTGVDGEYNGRVYGSCGVTLDPEAPYTAYADLTQDQVLDWIWASGVDKDETENAVNAQIESQKNPTVVTPPLPWSSTQAV